MSLDRPLNNTKDLLTAGVKVDEAIKADTDPAMKNDVDMANKEMDMAKMAMKDGKMDDCSMHIGNAMKSMMMKQ